jgi:hypothetical protein
VTDRWWAAAPGADSVPDAHLLAAVDAACAGSGVVAELVCTHVDRSAAGARTGVSLRWAGAPADPSAFRSALVRELAGPVLTADDPAGDDPASSPARTALREARTGTGGRAVRFPGSSQVSGRVSVAELLGATAVDAVVGVGVPVTPADVVDTGSGFLRPQLEDARLVLLVERVVGGVFQPVEVADDARHQCCGGVH